MVEGDAALEWEQDEEGEAQEPGSSGLPARPSLEEIRAFVCVYVALRERREVRTAINRYACLAGVQLLNQERHMAAPIQAQHHTVNGSSAGLKSSSLCIPPQLVPTHFF